MYTLSFCLDSGIPIRTWEAQYDERGNQIEKTYLGRPSYNGFNGEPRMAATAGRRDNNEYRKEIERIFFGLDRKPRPLNWPTAHVATCREPAHTASHANANNLFGCFYISLISSER